MYLFVYMIPLPSNNPFVFIRPEIFRMSELSDDPELQSHSQAVLYILSAVAPPPESIEAIGTSFVSAISSSTVYAPLFRVS